MLSHSEEFLAHYFRRHETHLVERVLRTVEVEIYSPGAFADRVRYMAASDELRARPPMLTNFHLEAIVADPAPEPLDQLVMAEEEAGGTKAKAEEAAWVREGLSQLSERYREVITAKMDGELGRVTAERLGMSWTNVKQLGHRARLKLKRILR